MTVDSTNHPFLFNKNKCKNSQSCMFVGHSILSSTTKMRGSGQLVRIVCLLSQDRFHSLVGDYVTVLGIQANCPHVGKITNPIVVQEHSDPFLTSRVLGANSTYVLLTREADSLPSQYYTLPIPSYLCGHA